MSPNDILGPVTRALVGVPVRSLGIFLDLANKIAGKEGREWYWRISQTLREGLNPSVHALGRIDLRPVQRKKTELCFLKEGRYGFGRDPELVKRFPTEWPERRGGCASVFHLWKSVSYVEMAQHALRTKETSVEQLSKVLIESDQAFFLPEIESLIDRHEEGEDVGLVSHYNFFFVRGLGDQITVVRARPDERSSPSNRWWHLEYSDLSSDPRWMPNGHRFFFRN